MKKSLVGLLITLLLIGITGTTALGYTLSSKLAVQADGKYHMDQPTLYTDLDGYSDNGIFISSDLLVDVRDNLKIGGGIGFSSLNRFHDIIPELKVGHIPLYFAARYEIPTENGHEFYLVGKLGYSFLLVDSDTKDDYDPTGGLYYELGGGLTFGEVFFVETTYSANWGSLKDKSFGNETSVKTSAVNLGIGVNLEL